MSMAFRTSKPRILIVTPEVAFLPSGMGDDAEYMNARAGGLADVSSSLISALYQQGADVHVAIPDYRAIFRGKLPAAIQAQRHIIQENVPDQRIHLAKDRAFFYLDHLDYYVNPRENIKIALAFQRDVINNIVPRVQPDLIHCNDWMTALIPAMARQLRIPCLFTFHNILTVKITLSEIESRGIDAASFWQSLYYESFPSAYEHTRDSIPVDLLASGVFAAHFVNTVSPSFFEEIIEGRHDFVPVSLQKELANKKAAGCAMGILNAPDPSYNPAKDGALACPYSPENHAVGKKSNKQALQKKLGLIQDARAPMLFWPSRLDASQKGCQLMAEVLYHIVSRYWDAHLQIVFVADGEYQKHFQHIVDFHHLSNRVAVCNFNEQLSRLAYGASDFVLMPSYYEPCGLVQMIGAIYGALPIAHDTGGIHDTITQLNIPQNSGNGFLFKTFNADGLKWAIDQAIQFHRMPQNKKDPQIQRIMRQSALAFNHQVTAQQYIVLYESLLQRPLIEPASTAHVSTAQNNNQNISGRQLQYPAFTNVDFHAQSSI